MGYAGESSAKAVVLHENDFCPLSVIKATQDETSILLKPELGHLPISINIEKIALNFWMHLRPSPKEPMKRLTNPVTNTNTEHTAQTCTALHLNINSQTGH